MAAARQASLTVSRLHDPSEHMAGGYVYGITDQRDPYFQVLKARVVHSFLRESLQPPNSATFYSSSHLP